MVGWMTALRPTCYAKMLKFITDGKVEVRVGVTSAWAARSMFSCFWRMAFTRSKNSILSSEILPRRGNRSAIYLYIRDGILGKSVHFMRKSKMKCFIMVNRYIISSVVLKTKWFSDSGGITHCILFANTHDLLPFYVELLDSIACSSAPYLQSNTILSHALKSKAGLDQSSQRSNMSALCMNHVNLVWWAGLCAKMQMMFSVSYRCEWIPGLPPAPVVMVIQAHSGRE